MRRLLALAMLCFVTACQDCAGVSCPGSGLDVSANEIRGGSLEVCVGERCKSITMPADTEPRQPAPERSVFRVELSSLGVWPKSSPPPATGAVSPTVFEDRDGFVVTLTLKDAAGTQIASKETRAQRMSGKCCGPYWTARI